MSPKPGTRSRSAGCFGAIFFSFFLAPPIFILWIILFKDENIQGDFWAAAIVLCLFFIVGLTGVIYNIRNLLGISQKKSATVPGNTLQITTLPKTRPLRLMANGYYRLNPELSHRNQFWILLVVAVIWNSITWFSMGISLIKETSNSPPIWVVLLFGGAGLFLIGMVIRSFITLVAVGETHVDINSESVFPGQNLEILVTQPGRYAINELAIDIICREKATYKAGTDTRTKTEIVQTLPICKLTNLQSRDGQVLAHQSCTIPENSTLSFYSNNNEISWIIKVKMDLPGRPDIEQLFPFRMISLDIQKMEANFHD